MAISEGRAEDANLILTGFMATGKTAVGRIVAKRLGRPFVDTDDLIEERAGKAIRDIFAEEGEEAFREMETQVCRDLRGRTGLVIATGGGMLLNLENRRLLEASGRVICLTARAESIVARLGANADRPLLAEPDPLAAARRILAQRESVYASFEHRIDTTDLAPDEVADEALRLWRARRLAVHGPGGEYRILVQEGLLSHPGHVLRQTLGVRPVAVVSNPTVWDLYGPRLADGLASAGFPVTPCLIPDGEEHKRLETVAELYGQFLAANLDRSGMVLALGGGVVGDVAGFAAATFMRGIPVVQAPTTLLSMVDSSVGGKTGVDLPEGKNLVGAFHQPALVLIDPDALATLPDVQVRCGLAEVLKAGVIADARLFELLRAGPPWPWTEVIGRALAVKIAVVEEDPYEKGRRAVLNLGHTVGHALERLSDYGLPHGEAVAVGLVVAAHIAARLGRCEPGLVAQIASALEQLGLPTAWPGSCTPDDVLGAMAHDKKRRQGRQRWILPRRIGKVEIVDDVPTDVVRASLAETRANATE